MLSLRIGDAVYALGEESSSELVRRLTEGEGPPLVGDQPERGSLPDRLRDGLHSREPVDLDNTETVMLGIALEAWLVERDGDLRADVEELRDGIASALRGRGDG